MAPGQQLYWYTMSIITAIFALAGLFDYVLYANRLPTITDWLRSNPLWFVWPALCITLFVIILGIHLFAHKLR